ncbi:hypothetical protein DFP93_10693 [Aneurinibacillus soli]|uniref:Uncharacterized protein n=1 Tax=Aneurinibacillus soli TaxID=1500254 RepID=A0A0U4NM37_9BACL|nr:hypothetical protein [Aneurinibacillus soli]PYE61900.1 hypothetical protein DFP93_10693 [Aneurinibacillus soli]BAU29716.1 hypothetical protein CB4_03953 [Aneurinibacillus soli]
MHSNEEKITWVYGLDLVGYGSDKGALVKSQRIDQDCDSNVGKKEIKIISNIMPYFPNQDNNQPVEVLEKNDIRFILKNKLYPLVIDAPIEPLIVPPVEEKNWRRFWEYISRDVDKFFNGAPPGRLETLSKRAEGIRSGMKCLMKNGKDPLNKRLFETYPAATILQLYREGNQNDLNGKGDMRQYKETLAQWDMKEGAWITHSLSGKTEKSDRFAKLLEDFSIVAETDKTIITDDEFDALLSTLVLLSSDERVIFSSENVNNPVYIAMKDDSMFSYRKGRVNEMVSIATGYRILTKKFWDKIVISRQSESVLPNDVKNFITKKELINIIKSMEKSKRTLEDESILSKIERKVSSFTKKEKDRVEELLSNLNI